MANTLINIPIEPLEDRYSEQWDRWFKQHLRTLERTRHLEHITVYGTALTDRIDDGCFLDVIGTNAYKASQLFEICKLLKDGTVTSGDVFLFHDAWFPGVEMLAYIRDAMGINFKLCGMLHAGSYDPHDFLHRVGMQRWANLLERSWLRIYDKLFVASEFHKSMVIENRILISKWTVELASKIEVCNWPMDANNLFAIPKQSELLLERAGAGWELRKPLLVFPHRMDPEKRYWEWCLMREQFLRGLHPEDKEHWYYVTTKTQCHTKARYYDTLASARIAVSFADQETFGIAMQEATLLGCIPLVPDRLAYKEMYPAIFRCKDWCETRDKALRIVQDLKFRKQCCLERGRLARVFNTNGTTAIRTILLSAMQTADEYRHPNKSREDNNAEN